MLILDCDFRRPRLHQIFGTRETPGLADVLEDPRRFSADNEVMCSTSVDGVRLVPAGTPTDNPARLFNRARSLIQASRRQADIVLIDTPPYLVANDAAELIPWVDAVVITVKSRRTRRGTTERMIENLDRQQAPVVGIVLVGADDAGSGYSPYYYHRANARTDKARRRWRRVLRLGPPKDKTSTQPEADEPQPEDDERPPEADEPPPEALLTAAGTEALSENGSEPPTASPRPSGQRSRNSTDASRSTHTATEAETDSDADASPNRTDAEPTERPAPSSLWRSTTPRPASSSRSRNCRARPAPGDRHRHRRHP